MTVYTLSNRV